MVQSGHGGEVLGGDLLGSILGTDEGVGVGRVSDNKNLKKILDISKKEKRTLVVGLE